jgi:hypothetical protein
VAETSTGTVDCESTSSLESSLVTTMSLPTACTAITARSRDFSTEPRHHVEDMDNEQDRIAHESIIQQRKVCIVNAEEEVAVHDRTSLQASLVDLSKSCGSTTGGISSTMMSGDVGFHTDCSAERFVT